MLVGRSLQGVGGGGIIALSEIIVTDLVPLRYRGTWFGYLSSMWAVGSVSGPVSRPPFTCLWLIGKLIDRTIDPWRCFCGECVVEMDFLHKFTNYWRGARLRHGIFEAQLRGGVLRGEAEAI
jgi:MFS family permease